MFEPTITIFGQRFATYSLVLSLAVLLSLIRALWYTPASQRAALTDVALLALLGGLVGARASHVVAHWDHFRVVPAEILQLQAGGLDWHGALIGAWLMGTLAARYRKLNSALLHVHAAWTLPILALAGWWGCWAAACAYGREVATLADYPAWLVWEGRDIFGIIAPRFHTQLVGILAAIGLLLLAWWLARHTSSRRRRWWWLLLVWSLVMFALGFLRADSIVVLHSLRMDQVYDLIVAVSAIIGLLWLRRNNAAPHGIP